MEKRALGQSDLKITPICLGTMTFGEQVNEGLAHQILDASLELGVDFWDTAEMYSVPARQETSGSTETILGNWFARNPSKRADVVLATKVAGPSRNMHWIREGLGMTPEDIIASCEGSLRRLQTDVIDLYQIHWPERNVPVFGEMYFDPSKERTQTTIHAQLQALKKLVDQGKVRHIGLSNETPFGVHEFVRLAEEHNLPRVVSIQNPYCLTNRSYENALDETCFRLDVGLLAYSPLAFGALTGKYDATGHLSAQAPAGRLRDYESVQKQRWGRPAAMQAAKRYNELAHAHGLTPVQLALSFCYHKWQVASTIIGVTSLEQLQEDVAAWQVKLSDDVLAEVNAIRQELRDPAI